MFDHFIKLHPWFHRFYPLSHPPVELASTEEIEAGFADPAGQT